MKVCSICESPDNKLYSEKEIKAMFRVVLLDENEKPKTSICLHCIDFHMSEELKYLDELVIIESLER